MSLICQRLPSHDKGAIHPVIVHVVPDKVAVAGRCIINRPQLRFGRGGSSVEQAIGTGTGLAVCRAESARAPRVRPTHPPSRQKCLAASIVNFPATLDRLASV